MYRGWQCGHVAKRARLEIFVLKQICARKSPNHLGVFCPNTAKSNRNGGNSCLIHTPLTAYYLFVLQSGHWRMDGARAATADLRSGNTPLSPYLRRTAFIASVRSPRNMASVTNQLDFFITQLMVCHLVEYLRLLVVFILR